MSKEQQEDFKEKKDLKGLVMAVADEPGFQVLSTNTPKSLQKIMGAKLLDHSIKILIDNDIEDIILYANSHKEQYQEYVKQIQEQYPKLKIQLLYLPLINSYGKLLREIKNLKIIKHDFVVIYGDTIGQIDLKSALKFWEQNRKNVKADGANIMCKIFGEQGMSSCYRNKEKNLLVVEDDAARIVYYDHVNLTKNNCLWNIATKIPLKELGTLKMRANYVDSFISICSQDVIEHFGSESFSDQDTEAKFLNLLLDDECEADQPLAYVMDNKKDFVVRVNSPNDIRLAYKDLLRGWSDHLLNSNPRQRVKDLKDRYSVSDFNRYLGSEVNLHYSVKYSNNCVIGCGTSIDENAEIVESFIGEKCTIGKNVEIKDSVVLDNVIIGDNVKISNSLIGHGSEIPENSVHNEDITGAMMMSKEDSEALKRNQEDYENQLTKQDSKLQVNSKALNSDESLNITVSDKVLFKKSKTIVQSMNIRKSKKNWKTDKAGFSDDENIGDSNSTVVIEEDEEILEDVVEKSIQEAIADLYNIEAVKNDLINLRISKNVSYSEITRHAIPVIFNDIIQFIQNRTADQTVGEIYKDKIQLWAPLFKKFNIGDVEVLLFFNAVNNYVLKTEEPTQKMKTLLQIFWMKQISGKSLIQQWLDNLEGVGFDSVEFDTEVDAEKVKSYREGVISQCREFQKYLCNDDTADIYEESDDDSSDNDDSEDEEGSGDDDSKKCDDGSDESDD